MFRGVMMHLVLPIHDLQSQHPSVEGFITPVFWIRKLWFRESEGLAQSHRTGTRGRCLLQASGLKQSCLPFGDHRLHRLVLPLQTSQQFITLDINLHSSWKNALRRQTWVALHLLGIISRGQQPGQACQRITTMLTPSGATSIWLPPRFDVQLKLKVQESKAYWNIEKQQLLSNTDC